MRNILILMLAAAVLAACGGGDAGDDAPAAAPAIHPPARITVQRTSGAPIAMVIGDSTMTPVYPGEPATPALAADRLGLPIDNHAASGTAAYQAPLDAIAATPAPIVVANYAINDSASIPAESYRQHLQAIATATARAGKWLILLQANPIVSGGFYSPQRDDATVRRYDAIKRQVAAEVGAIWCALPAHDWTLADVPDGVHPSAASGKPIAASALAGCIQQVIDQDAQP